MILPENSKNKFNDLIAFDISPSFLEAADFQTDT